jgi:hypothetical protein
MAACSIKVDDRGLGGLAGPDRPHAEMGGHPLRRPPEPTQPPADRRRRAAHERRLAMTRPGRRRRQRRPITAMVLTRRPRATSGSRTWVFPHERHRAGRDEDRHRLPRLAGSAAGRTTTKPGPATHRATDDTRRQIRLDLTGSFNTMSMMPSCITGRTPTCSAKRQARGSLREQEHPQTVATERHRKHQPTPTTSRPSMSPGNPRVLNKGVGQHPGAGVATVGHDQCLHRQQQHRFAVTPKRVGQQATVHIGGSLGLAVVERGRNCPARPKPCEGCAPALSTCGFAAETPSDQPVNLPRPSQTFPELARVSGV